MAKKNKPFAKKGKIETFSVFPILLLILLVVFSFYYYFVVAGENTYRIENKYYGFELKIPNNWLGEENTYYSEDNIAQILDECKNDNSNEAPVYEIGLFRFKNQKYSQELGSVGNFSNDAQSGAVLEVAVKCIPDGYAKNKITDYSFSNFKIAGERAFVGSLNLNGFSDAKYFSLFHNNFEYKINEYVYVSPNDKERNEEKIINKNAKIFNKIISSFKFLK